MKLETVFPFDEAAAYEALWTEKTTSFKSLSKLFAEHPKSRPTNFVNELQLENFRNLLRELIAKSHYKSNILVRGTFDYPAKLNDAKENIEILYYSGNLDYLNTKSIAIVGTRNPTQEGLKRTEKLVKMLVEKDYTIMSGLAKGIDTKAHLTALENNGRTIAIIGTPLNSYYPKENKSLQDEIAKKHLLMSQVPFYRYTQQTIHGNKLFFPERNKTMSALSIGTIIVEASDTSGTLIQARAALEQGRKLFILNSCFENKSIKWPEKFEKLGAIRVREFSDILNVLEKL